MMISSKLSVAFLAAMTQVLSVNAKITIDMFPFSIELSSNADSQSTDLRQELLDLTTDHLASFIKSQGSVWVDVDTVSLTVKTSSLENDNDGSYTSTTSFTGRLEWLDSEVAPDNTELKDIQSAAFIGQSKLNYLSAASQSSDDFLKGVNNVKITITEPSGNNSNLGSILVPCAIGILVAAFLIGGYFFIASRRGQNRQTSRKRNNLKHERLRNEMNSLELAETGSMSPPNGTSPTFFDGADSINLGPKTVASKDTIDVNNSMDMLAWKNNFHDEVPFDTDITRISKEEVGAQSVVSKDTVDVHSNKDMLAWKHTDNTIPFDADITGISNNSPNKTLDIEIDHGRTGKKTSNSNKKKSKNLAPGYLSRDILSQHEESRRFDDHARKYADKVKPKKTAGSSRRS